MSDRRSLLGGARRKQQQRETSDAEQRWLQKPASAEGHSHQAAEQIEIGPAEPVNDLAAPGELSEELETLRFEPAGPQSGPYSGASEESAEVQSARVQSAGERTATLSGVRAVPAPEEPHPGQRRRGGRVRKNSMEQLARTGWFLLLVVLLLTVVIAAL